MEVAESGVYDGWFTGRLFSGDSKIADGAGVLVPLTPTIALDCLLLACWHTTQKEPIRPFTLSMVASVSAPWSLFSNIHERVTLSALLDPNIPASFPWKVAQELISPSFPRANLELIGTNFTGHADIALLRPKNWPTIGAYPQPELQGFENFFVPCCDSLQKDQYILVLGHGGSRPSREWAARYLKTRADLDNLETPQEGWSLYNISPALPQQRLDDVLDSAIFPKTLTISPGRVHAANDSVLEHTASVVPGISGGAGIDIRRPWRLYFIHIQSVDNVEKP
ncbi:hypothetical protein ABBQ38_014157 [Trebouxia sp. C0009 RCD-2024]